MFSMNSVPGSAGVSPARLTLISNQFAGETRALPGLSGVRHMVSHLNILRHAPNIRAMKLPAFLPLTFSLCCSSIAADIRIGIIGCDTSHVIAFTENLNNPNAKNHVAGGKVVAAFKGGSKDIPESMSRVDGYQKTLTEKHGVKFYDTIDELCKNVDAVLLESLDGRPKLEQIKPVLKAHKPVFVDKPMGGSLRDVKEIFRLAKEAKVPIFSSSSLRFARDTQDVHNGSIGQVSYAETYGPCELEPHHPDLFCAWHSWR